MTDTAVAHSGSTLTTPDIVKTMLAAGPGVSDLIFSPGRPAQVEKHGELVAVVLDVPFLRPDDTNRIAQDLIGGSEQATRNLKEQGACDLSYSLPDVGRFAEALTRARQVAARARVFGRGSNSYAAQLLKSIGWR